MTKIGVLAIQGDFLEHKQMLARLGVEATEIRLPNQLDGVDGLIIPGGESTTIVQLIDIYHFRETLKDKAKSGMPVWGTCAGMIVISDKLTDRRPEPLHIMDIEVSRNAFGRQVDSFEADIEFKEIEGPPYHCIFIRAPVVNKMGDGVTSAWDAGVTLGCRRARSCTKYVSPGRPWSDEDPGGPGNQGRRRGDRGRGPAGSANTPARSWGGIPPS